MKYRLELATDHPEWVDRGDVWRIVVPETNSTAFIHPSDIYSNLYHVRLSMYGSRWHQVQGFLSAQLKALELLGGEV